MKEWGFYGDEHMLNLRRDVQFGSFANGTHDLRTVTD